MKAKRKPRKGPTRPPGVGSPAVSSDEPNDRRDDAQDDHGQEEGDEFVHGSCRRPPDEDAGVRQRRTEGRKGAPPSARAVRRGNFPISHLTGPPWARAVKARFNRREAFESCPGETRPLAPPPARRSARPSRSSAGVAICRLRRSGAPSTGGLEALAPTNASSAGDVVISPRQSPGPQRGMEFRSNRPPGLAAEAREKCRRRDRCYFPGLPPFLYRLKN